MVGTLKVEVPISIKGSADTAKAGKQIGEKIASELKRSLGSIGIGKGGGGVDLSGAAGLTKGMKGMTAKLGIIAGGVAAVVGLLSTVSPMLRGILQLFGRAFAIFFRPFGDFLAILLRPLAIILLKMAVAVMRFLQPLNKGVSDAIAAAPQIPETGNLAADIPIMLANWLIQIGAAIGFVALELGKAFFQLGVSIGELLVEKVIEPVSKFITGKLLEIGVVINKGFEFFQTMGEDLWNIIKAPFEFVANKISAIFGGGGGGGKNLGAIQSFLPKSESPESLLNRLFSSIFGGGKESSKSVVLNTTLNVSGPQSTVSAEELARLIGEAQQRDLRNRGII